MKFPIHIVLALPVIWLLAALKTSASPDSTIFLPPPPAIIYVGHLNTDAYQDTIVSAVDTSIHNQWYEIPNHIRWGKAVDTLPTSQTQITYPAWNNRQISLTVVKVNADSIPDLIFFISGEINVDTVTKDTSRILCIFGQSDLDTILTFHTGQIDTVQLSPFQAQDLQENVSFLDGDYRDNTSNQSYVFQRITVVPLDPPPPPEISLSTYTELTSVSKLKVYPNPASTSVSFDAESLPAGEYKIVLLTVDGTIAFKKEFFLVQESHVSEELELTNKASGVYTLIFMKESQFFQSYKITVIK